MSNTKPDTIAINDFLRNPRNDAQRFTVTQDSRSRKVTTTTQDGETFEGPDGLNDAIYRLATGAEPRNRRGDDEGGGTA